MCRWLAYSGSPIPLDSLLYKPKHSLIDQSQHAEMGAETTNGDGFGIGWYPVDPVEKATPGRFRGILPAWSDRNLRDLAEHIRSPLFFAHVRASSGTAVQESNCHPFQHERWLWMHNGSVRDFARMRRDLLLAVDPALYPDIQGTTDSEALLYLALTYGLRDDPVTAVERTVGFVEATAASHGIQDPVQMTVATTEGERIWVFRYSSAHQSRTLFYSRDVNDLRQLHPEVEALRQIPDGARLVVSEPLGVMPDAFVEVPESSYSLIYQGQDKMSDFNPR
ncbi:glutamine amidotransferase [Asanoa ferruginea]|uniref:Glutamine amidotransferase n=1 Tax=Asanoa ferruginea TaxID=53367 RepID=A0A3D9ZL51_9ACTN|nr:class II glutamine amidotransferase [Asanoa ferruginea]REF97941.1 glutamine amidotransferase [Asanoa ferruginea]GIF50033.1 class II glutamine amidotransferase [Asanoa ferruginea]